MTEKEREQLGVELRKARIENDLTLEEVGNKVGKTAKSIQLYETGTTTISINVLVDLCKVYGITPGTILDKIIK